VEPLNGEIREFEDGVETQKKGDDKKVRDHAECDGTRLASVTALLPSHLPPSQWPSPGGLHNPATGEETGVFTYDAKRVSAPYHSPRQRTHAATMPAAYKPLRRPPSSPTLTTTTTDNEHPPHERLAR
jgi:hypothetical protein